MILLLLLLASLPVEGRQLRDWPPTRFTVQRTEDPTVVLHAFEVERSCISDEWPVQVETSAWFPQLLPADRHRRINDELRRAVLTQVDIECTGPLHGAQVPERGEIFADCKVRFRSAMLLTVECDVGWSGPAMGAHPDGRTTATTYRIPDGRRLERADLLREESLGVLEQRLRAILAEEYCEELEDSSVDVTSDVAASLMAAPFLTKEGIGFEYFSRLHGLFHIVIPYSEAEMFLRDGVLAHPRPR